MNAFHLLYALRVIHKDFKRYFIFNFLLLNCRFAGTKSAEFLTPFFWKSCHGCFWTLVTFDGVLKDNSCKDKPGDPG